MTAGLQQAMGNSARGRKRLLLLTTMVVSVVLNACGGGGEEEAAPAAAPPGAGPAPIPNVVPTISGSPVGSVVVGTAYSFTPTASDGDGDILTFSVTGKPTWATFSTSTGRLSGTPSQADVGIYPVMIKVTDGAADATLASFSIQVVATATGSATLSWAPPTQNNDGTPLTNLAGYKIYWGTDQNSLANSATVTNAGLSSYVVDQLTPATWFFATKAFNALGVESALSNVASKTVM